MKEVYQRPEQKTGSSKQHEPADKQSSQEGKSLSPPPLQLSAATPQQPLQKKTQAIQRATAADTYKKIKKAGSGWGTDESGIFNAIRQCSDLPGLRANKKVWSILKSELSGDDYFKAKLLMRYGTETNYPQGILLIREATKGAGTDEELIYEAIRSSNDRARLKKDPWVKYILKDELSGFEYVRTELLFNYGNESSFPAYIQPMIRAGDRWGTDETLLFRTLVSLSPTDLAEMQKNKVFVARMRDELSGSDLKRFDRILAGKGPAMMDGHHTDTGYGAAETGDIATRGFGDTNAFSPNDINQGNVGDCYFLSSLGATANTNPGLLSRNITGPLPDGSYNVKLYVRDGKNLKSQIVNVTPRFPQPVAAGGQTYAYGGDMNAMGDTELWVRLYEKAFAKLKGSYEEIDGGWGNEALEAVTGKRAERIKLDRLSNDEIKTKVQNGLTNNEPSTTSTKTDKKIKKLEAADVTFATNNGIVGRHEYMVINVSNTGITVRNPHGIGSGGGTAQFSMTWAQYRKYYQDISLIKRT